MKKLPPSLREKQRYFKFQIHSEENIDLGELVDAVWDSSLSYLGVKGCSEANFWVIGNKFEEEKQEGVIRVRRSEEDNIRAVLTMVDEIGGKDAVVEVEQVSGSVKKLD